MYIYIYIYIYIYLYIYIYMYILLKISDLQHQIFRGDRQFPSSMVLKYVELLNRFDVAIKISDKFLLVPSLLPDQQKECLIVAENQSSLLQNAMNISTYLQYEVFRRQYLLTYVPSGLWARLLTRLEIIFQH